MSELRAIESVLREYRRDINGLRVAVGEVGTQVADIGVRQRDTQDQLLALRNGLLRLEQQAERTKHLHSAEAKVGQVKADIEQRFGHHKVVRRTAVGILRAFDRGLVREETVQTVSEELMVQNSRYWLAPVLVALAAWVGDDQERCVRALEDAYSHSPERTSLFMTLVLRRQGRRSAAVRWLRHYLDAQDPAALGREFPVILEAIAQGAFGPAGVALVQERLDRWRRLLLDDEAVAAQVRRWREELNTHIRADGLETDFPRLATATPQWPQLRLMLSHADAHQSIIDRYAPLLAAEATVSSDIEDAVDDLLEQLVSESDREELPLRRELLAYEAVVRSDGDLAAAEQLVRTEADALDDTRDYLSLQTDCALTPETLAVSPQTQRLALANCHDWLAQAHESFTRDYRLAAPQTVQMVVDPAASCGIPAFRPPRWQGSFDEPLGAMEHLLTTHWDRASRSFVDSLTFTWGRNLIGPSVFLLLLLVITWGLGGPGAGLLVTAAAGIAWAVVLKGRADRAAAEQARVRTLIDDARDESLRDLRATGMELETWYERFKAADGKAGEVTVLIADLATAGGPESSHDRRVVARITEGE
ncbi:hypothetical protein B5D80_20465 [Micromonospora wenchangensis]|uniref:Uncharacterized protein n=1 Tax=Micromonospora wenchangensis TaxID=1185415 RepID=A0A246RIE1_9ACTN|nr:hypothetical protein [Micromonospora wenchangensis]OWV04286.1 hypothetical protein B5D80_20465 [Micromonospora wenchangensis]